MAMKWDEVFKIWDETMKTLGADMLSIFESVTLDSECEHGEVAIIIILDGLQPLPEKKTKWQKYFDGNCTSFPAKTYSPSRADIVTINEMWRNRGNLEKVAAVMLAASLSSRLCKADAFPVSDWPDFWKTQSLLKVVENAWHGDGMPYTRWHHSSRDRLPTISSSFGAAIKDIPTLIAFLAEEHAEMLRKYRIIETKIQMDLYANF